MKRNEFYKELRKLTNFEIRVADSSVNEIYEMGLERKIIDAFRNNSNYQSALDDLNKEANDGKDFIVKFYLENRVIGKYLKFKKIYRKSIL